jgi:Zn-dependent peptidase ImmA (M78 family)
MGKSSICDVDKNNTKESFCNKVAAEVLVPKETLKMKNYLLKMKILILKSYLICMVVVKKK